MASIRVRILQFWLELIPIGTPKMMASIWKTGQVVAPLWIGRTVVVIEMPMGNNNVGNLVGSHICLGQPSQQTRRCLILRNDPRVVGREVIRAGINED